jgi:hypothetical protein
MLPPPDSSETKGLTLATFYGGVSTTMVPFRGLLSLRRTQLAEEQKARMAQISSWRENMERSMPGHIKATLEKEANAQIVDTKSEPPPPPPRFRM